MSATDYRQQLQALLPQGVAWTREPDATLTRLLDGIAEELARVDARGEALTDEADPRTTLELLADWERVAGLPDACTPPAQTISERRGALVSRITDGGGLSRARLIAAAAAIGFTITITEFRPFRAGMSTAGGAVTNGDWVSAWQSNGLLFTVSVFSAGANAAGEPLRKWGNELLECVLSRLTPAHNTPIFSYA